MLNQYTLFVAQLLAHLSLIPMILFGSTLHWCIALVIYFLNGCIGMTMTYHRLLSHKSWVAPKWFYYLGTLLATIGMTGSAISWVAIHRKHHRFSDTEKDPHSPSFKGFVYCQWFSMFIAVDLKYVIDLLQDKFMCFQHKYYFLIIFLYASILYMIDPFAIVYAWLVPACILWNAGSSIVTLGHMWGSNPANLQSKAKNNWVLALLVWGEGWHNNHHKDQKDPIFNRYFDFGGTIIKFLDKNAAHQVANK